MLQQGWVILLVLALSTWRITSLLVNEEGPRNILVKFRYFIGVRFDENSEPYGLNVLADALTCVWCTSPYIGLFVWVSWLVFGQPVIIVLMPLAISAAAILVDVVVSK